MLSLGCEIEFVVNRGQVDEVKRAVSDYDIHDEFYPGQLEINSFLTRGKTVPQLVRALNEHVEKVLKALQPFDPMYVCAFPVANGFAFTGIHLHLQDTDNIPTGETSRHCLANRVGDAVMSRIAHTTGLSARQVFSHHIWGRYRDSRHSWKRSSRFKPCLFNTTHRTFELRAIDFEQLLPCNYKHLCGVLRAAFDTIQGKNRHVDTVLVEYLKTVPSDICTEREEVEACCDNRRDYASCSCDDPYYQEETASWVVGDIVEGLRRVAPDVELKFSVDKQRGVLLFNNVRSLAEFDIKEEQVTYSTNAQRTGGVPHLVDSECDQPGPRCNSAHSALRRAQDTVRQRELEQREQREQERAIHNTTPAFLEAANMSEDNFRQVDIGSLLGEMTVAFPGLVGTPVRQEEE